MKERIVESVDSNMKKKILETKGVQRLPTFLDPVTAQA